MRLNYIDNIDCLEGLAQIPDNSVDLIVTDPPYFLSMGHAGSKENAFLKWTRPWDADLWRLR